MPYDPDLTRINAHGPFHRSRNHPTYMRFLAIPDVYEVATKMWKALTEEEKQQYFVEAKLTSSKSKETLVARCAPKRFIKTVMKESNMLHMIGFIDPSVTGALGCGNSTERSRSLSDAFKRGKPGQTFLAPYNSGYHWILTVVNTTEDLVYYMDLSKRRMDVTTDEWKTIVNHAIKIANAHIPTKKAQKVQWKNCSGIPEQIGDKTCGYFIMLYRREIVLDKNQDWSKKWLTRGDAYYTTGNVDVVREEWAKYILKFTND